jgi:hypothetical protein
MGEKLLLRSKDFFFFEKTLTFAALTGRAACRSRGTGFAGRENQKTLTFMPCLIGLKF